ncbi:hypothetical protein BCV69DRAFT_283157 [Microstroma glucosiphilum]|uniref:Serine/threonine-protein kinase Tel1 n=1 Tax=Pseudomicrostroma glucosiphilum TaxID=1684307 RepID=A0A316U502_9BASI|nr:hypothetical protein BCV69DRAFT_283157 [Pseudomicrostroma glucosiphilum]PWN20280.1 hypothetical protein BCV69DRAFT_283157 [Pseudomicrostroma glucosiphilum]
MKLDDAIRCLQHEKPSERAAGLEMYRQIFSKEYSLTSLTGDDSTWTQVFQALFQCVLTELTACSRKGHYRDATAVQLSKLTAASRTVRWLTERACPHFQRKTAKALTTHLGQTVARNGELITPIALDYLKALRAILAYPPHRNSVDQEQWAKLATLCFNVVLSRNTKEALPHVNADAWQRSQASSDADGSSRSLGLEDIEEMGCLEELLSSSLTPLHTEENLGPRLLVQYALFFAKFPAESTAHFPAVAGLNKLLREIELDHRRLIDIFIAKTWRTLSNLWESKNKAFKEQLIVTFRILLPHLTAKVPTPLPASAPSSAKEPDIPTVTTLLVLLQRQLNGDADNRFSVGPLPLLAVQLSDASSCLSSQPLRYPSFSAGTDFTATSAISWATLELASDVVAHMSGDRYGPPLSHSSVALDSVESPGEQTEPEDLTHRSTRKRTASNRLRRAPDPTAGSSPQVTRPYTSSPTTHKRRRVETSAQIDALETLLSALSVPTDGAYAKAQGKRVWSLQVLLFLVVRHWSQLSLEQQDRVFRSTQGMLVDLDDELQCWSLICLGSIAVESSLDERWREGWSHAWSLCCRRINAPATSREAAMAATALLHSGRLGKEQYLTELNSFFTDLDLSSPPFPHGSVANFFTIALKTCSSDVGLVKKNFEEKVAWWLTSTWSPTHGVSKGPQSRLKLPEQSPACTLRLIAQICRLDEDLIDISDRITSLPGCAAMDQIIYEMETASIRAFVLDAVLSGQSRPAQAVQDARRSIVASKALTPAERMHHEGDGDFDEPNQHQRGANPLEKRLYNFLDKELSDLSREWARPSADAGAEVSAFADTASVGQTRKTIELVTVSLLFDAALAASHVRLDNRLALTAHRLLLQVLRTLAEPNRWALAECTSLAAALQPIVQGGPPLTSLGTSRLLQGIVEPGRRSGVRRQTLDVGRPTERRDSVPEARRLPFMQILWKTVPLDLRDATLAQMRACLQLLCGSDEGANQRSDAPDDDDDWGRIKQAKVDSETMIKPADDYGADRFALATSANLCLTALINVPRAVTGQPTPFSGELEKLILEESTVAIDRAGQDIFDALALGSVSLTYRSAAAIMMRLGVDYLPDHRFRHSEHAQLIVLHFLEATLKLWGDPDKADTDLAARSEEFCVHFAQSLRREKGLPWRVRVQAVHFFEVLMMSKVERDGWDDGGGALGASAIAALICGMARDGDIRVRFAVAPMVARLFESCPLGEEEGLLALATEQMSAEADHLEGMLARSLTSANIMIASSPLRATALFFLLEPCLLNKLTNTHAQELLRVVATSLGFPSTSDLFIVFAAQLTFGLVESGYDPTRLPAKVLGYQSPRQCLEHTFVPIGSMMAAMAIERKDVSNQFAGLARSIRKTEAQGVAECLPFVLATEFVFAVKDLQRDAAAELSVQVPDIISSIRKRLVSGGKALISAKAIDVAILEKPDQIMLSLLLRLWEKDITPESTFLRQIGTSDGDTATAYRSLSLGVPGSVLDVSPHEPIRPHASGLEIYRSIRALMSSIKDSIAMPCVYHVVQQMLSIIWKERLVNDQLRHLSALKLFVAMHSAAIAQNDVILRTLLHGVSVLMAQVDLLHSASGVAHWCLEQYMTRTQNGLFLTTSLTRIAEQAENWSRSRSFDLVAFGEKIFEWMEDHLIDLLSSPATQKSAFDAAIAFPRQLSGKLTSALTSSADAVSDSTGNVLNLDSISAALERNEKALLNRHTLSRIREALLAATSTEGIHKFARATIWHLFSRLPSRSVQSADTAVANVLADILFSLEGKVKVPTTGEGQANGDERHLQMLEGLLRGAETVFGPVKAYIALQLLEIHRGEDLGLAESTFSCLRAVMTLDPTFTLTTSQWPPSSVEELELLSAFPSRPKDPCQDKASTKDFLGEPRPATVFDDWICQLASYLCKRLAETEPNSFYSEVQPLMLSVTTLATRSCPALLQSLLALDYDRQDSTVESFRSEISQYFTKVLSNSQADPAAWSAVITAVLYMRKQRTSDVLDDPLSADKWFDIDFLLLASRSIGAKMFTTALLFVELAMEHQRDAFECQQKTVSELLYQIYSNVEDPDSFYGVKNPDLRLALIKRLHHEGEWQRAFEMYAADHESVPLVSGSTFDTGRYDASRSGVALALHEMGYNRLAASMSTVSSDAHGIDFEIGWRTDDWNLPLASHPPPGRSAGVFAALRALHRERDPMTIEGIVEDGFGNELRGLSGAKVEAVVEVRRIIRDLLSLREVKQWRSIIVESQGLDGALVKVQDWPALPEGFAFADCERILTVRQSLLRAERNVAQADQIGDLIDTSVQSALQLEGTLLLRLSKAARKRDRFQTAMNAVTMADKLNTQLAESAQLSGLYPEFASVLWSQGEHAIAMQALQDCLTAMPTKPKDPQERARRAILMAQLGQWRAIARSQQPRVIDEEFFRPAIALIEKQKKDCTAVYHQYALFADDQYRALRNSSETRQLEAFVSHRREEIRQHELQMNKYSPNTPEHNQFRHHRNQAQKICRQDEAVLEQHGKSKNAFLQQAFKMYAAALTHSNEFDDSAVKMTSLWFENADDADFNAATAEALAVVPSHKFLRLTHQLSSRLGKVSEAGASKSSVNAFHSNLAKLMTRMCSFHPFHCLYAIFALRKADLDQSGASPAKSSKRAGTPQSSQRSRGAAAHDLWNKVKATSPHKSRVAQLEKVCFAYVDWAELDLKTSMPSLFTKSGSIASGKHNVPTAMRHGIHSLHNVQAPVATAEIAVDPSSEYRDIPTIARYSTQFETAGGLHLPKITECIGSDGKRYKQLFKAQDDLRQDAVMQQVFTLLNGLLKSDQRAGERELKIRTYIVLPLGPQCGLLEFVGNTSPIGNIVVAAHEKYRRDEHLTPSQARSELASVGGKSPQEKLERYRQVCKEMPPCFRFYFFEQYKVPTTWFAARLNYTRSVAATSIIGHVLGLGDRHVSNILIDQVTGEVIHIDFGVAFEQGKLLPIPESVPFRLTRDMVDGMGLSGVEGVYRRCCEETLRVLRDGSDVIKTVLEVFKYDPLFAWTSNPVKVIRAQRDTDASGGGPSGTTIGSGSAAATADEQNLAGARDTASLSAERAIGSVMGKLSSSLSTQYTVNQLIQTAQDEANLSAIFHGWQPAL